MKVTVLGAGAMGCLYGGQISEAGYQVTLVDVWQEHIDTINRDGLTLEIDENTRNVRVHAVKAEELTEQIDLLIVFTKSIHTLAALDNIKAHLTPKTVALTLQNGLGNIEKIEQYIPRDRIVVGVTNIPGDLKGPGRVHSKGKGVNQIIAANGEASESVLVVKEMLEKAGMEAHISASAFVSIWEKVAFNAAVNSLGAILKIPMDQIGAHPISHDLAFAIAKETIAVANTKGIPANEQKVLDMLEDGFKHHIGHLPSMLQDVLAKRQTEIEAINGEVVRQAKAEGLSAPTAEMMYKLVKVTHDTYNVQVAKK